MNRKLTTNGNVVIIIVAVIALFSIVAGGILVMRRNNDVVTQKVNTNKQTDTSVDDNKDVPTGVIGFIGGSLTNNAAEGYSLLGGTRFWKTKGINFGGYGGGTIEKWADGIGSGGENAKYWKSFDQAYESSKSRGPTTVLWIQLLARGEFSDDEYYADAVKVIDEAHKRIPDAKIYVSAMNGYDPAGVCKTIEADTPDQMRRVAAKLVAGAKASVGPYIGNITASQVNDGDCHANDEGKKVEGQPILDFFGA